MDNDDRRFLLDVIDREWHRLDRRRSMLPPDEQEWYIEKQSRLSSIAAELRTAVAANA